MAQNQGRRDLRDELEADDGTYAESWKPSPGDILTGTVRSYSEAPGNYGPVIVCTVEDDGGTKHAVWLSATVLRNEFEKQKPKPGERIGIKYFGADPVKNYHRYRLIVDRANELPNFVTSATEDAVEPEGGWKLAGKDDADDADIPF